MQVTVEEVTGQSDFAICMAIRMEVFVFEQDVPADIEWDAFDRTSTHFFARADGKPVATARLRAEQGVAKIERMAVRKDYRGKHVGDALITKVMEHAKANGFTKASISAQDHAIPFYEKLGFTLCSDAYMEAGIPHHAMERDL